MTENFTISPKLKIFARAQNMKILTPSPSKILWLYSAITYQLIVLFTTFPGFCHGTDLSLRGAMQLALYKYTVALGGMHYKHTDRATVSKTDIYPGVWWCMWHDYQYNLPIMVLYCIGSPSWNPKSMCLLKNSVIMRKHKVVIEGLHQKDYFVNHNRLGTWGVTPSHLKFLF